MNFIIRFIIKVKGPNYANLNIEKWPKSEIDIFIVVGKPCSVSLVCVKTLTETCPCPVFLGN